MHCGNVAVQVLLKRNPTLKREERKKTGEEEVEEMRSMEVSSHLLPNDHRCSSCGVSVGAGEELETDDEELERETVRDKGVSQLVHVWLVHLNNLLTVKWKPVLDEHGHVRTFKLLRDGKPSAALLECVNDPSLLGGARALTRRRMASPRLGEWVTHEGWTARADGSHVWTCKCPYHHRMKCKARIRLLTEVSFFSPISGVLCINFAVEPSNR